MTLPPNIYLDIAVAVLAALAVVIWLLRRRRQDRLATDRIEPDDAGKEGMNLRLNRRVNINDAPIAQPPPVADKAPAQPRPIAANPNPPRPKARPFPIRGALSAQDYRGFEICLNERQPGLWIAAVKGSRATNKKDPAQNPEIWVSGEFYQSWAALAEAKAAVDRKARRKTGPA